MPIPSSVKRKKEVGLVFLSTDRMKRSIVGACYFPGRVFESIDRLVSVLLLFFPLITAFIVRHAEDLLMTK